MTTQHTPFVLACIDGSPASEAVCDYSSWVARKLRSPLKLLHTIERRPNAAVSDYSGAIGLGSQEELLEELTQLEQDRSRLLVKKGQIMLKAAKERVVGAGVDSPELCQRHGNLAESLVELESKTRMVILGIRGEAHGEGDAGIGMQLETVIRSMHKPIVVINGEFTEPKKVMLAYDGSECCKKALQMVATGELCKGLPCHVVHVGTGGETMLAEAETILKAAGVEVDTAQLQGKVEEVLAKYQAENAIDLTLMGDFSHGRFRKFLLGSFTAKMLAATQRPLILLR